MRLSAPATPDLGDLRAKLRDAGLFTHRELRTIVEIGVLLVGLVGCLLGVALWDTWTALLLVPLGSLFATSISMYGHLGSHRSFSASPTRNALLAHVAFPLFCGLSLSYWRDKHDRAHHAHPNVEGHDPDIKPFPFSSSAGGHAVCGRKEQLFQRHFQRWLFWPMSTLMVVGMRRSSLLHVWRSPRSAKWLLEVMCLAMHYVLWVVAPLVIFGPRWLVVYLVLWALVGVLLALIFAPAHMGLPIVSAPSHCWRHQLAATRNLELPRLISFFFVGLDYQIEHHLFPKLPHANLRAAAAITRTWCTEHGVPYQSVAYPAALTDSIRFMGVAWRRPATILE